MELHELEISNLEYERIECCEEYESKPRMIKTMDETERIIEAVRVRDLLWNLSNRNYKNIRLKAKAWKAISKELNLSIDFVKKRWRCLRDTYARNLNKQKISGQGADDSEIVGKYSVQMDFLRDHLKPRGTNGNYPPYTEEGSPRAISPTALVPDLDFSRSSPGFTDMDEAGPSTSSSTPVPLSSSNAAKRRKMLPQASAIEQTFLSAMTSVKEFISKPCVPPAVVVQSSSLALSNSEDELFCRSLAQKLSTFPIELRNSTKLEMLRYMNDVQMEWLSRSKKVANLKCNKTSK